MVAGVSERCNRIQGSLCVISMKHVLDVGSRQLLSNLCLIATFQARVLYRMGSMPSAKRTRFEGIRRLPTTLAPGTARCTPAPRSCPGRAQSAIVALLETTSPRTQRLLARAWKTSEASADWLDDTFGVWKSCLGRARATLRVACLVTSRLFGVPLVFHPDARSKKRRLIYHI